MFSRNVARNIKRATSVRHYAAHAETVPIKAAPPAPATSVLAEEDASTYPLTFESFPGRVRVKESADLVNEERQATRAVRETVLDGGFRVITTDSLARVGSTVSLYVNAGARNETFKTQGVSHFAQKFLFAPTNQRTHLKLAVELQKTGTQVSAQNGREDMVYRAEGLRQSLPTVLELMSNAVFQTRLHEYDMPPRRQQVKDDAVLLAQTPEVLLSEALHYKAFGGRTLGNSIVCPPHNAGKIGVKTVGEFMDKFYTLDRMTLVGTHINHDDLVDLARDVVLSQYSAPAAAAGATTDAKAESAENAPYTSKASAYVGGDHQIAELRDGETTHAALAFQGAAAVKGGDLKSYYATAALVELLGSGSNLYTASTAGRSSRLQQNLAAVMPQVVSARAFNLGYSDNGLVGVHLVTAGSGSGSKMSQALQRTVDELRLLRELSNDKQLEGAKNRLVYQLLRTLDDNAAYNEFVYKFGGNVEQHVEVVRSLTAQDVKAAATKALQSKPTLVTYGNLQNIISSAELAL